MNSYLPLSDRQHDVFDNPAKALCRDGNLRALREAAYPVSGQAGKIKTLSTTSTPHFEVLQ